MDIIKKYLFVDGYVNPQYVQNTIHYFCKIVMVEADRYNCSLLNGYSIICKEISGFSAAWSESFGVKAIHQDENLLSYFFNQQNKIPDYVYYWICRCYNGQAAIYSSRHYNTYNVLQREYVRRYRIHKALEMENYEILKERRRQVCRLYRSGKYPIAFSLYGKPLTSIFESDKLEIITDLLVELFGTDLYELSEKNIAAAYLIGVLQGEHNKETA